MQVEVKDVFDDVKFFSEALNYVRFYIDETSYIENAMPPINVWNAGKIEICTYNQKYANGMLARLEKYGIKATAVPKSGAIVFNAKAGDDIIIILDHTRKSLRLNMKSSQLNAIHDEVEQLARQSTYVKSSLFSRGVENLKHSVDVLNNVRMSQQKALKTK